MAHATATTPRKATNITLALDVYKRAKDLWDQLFAHL